MIDFIDEFQGEKGRSPNDRIKSWKRLCREGLIEIATNQSDPHASD